MACRLGSEEVRTSSWLPRLYWMVTRCLRALNLHLISSPNEVCEAGGVAASVVRWWVGGLVGWRGGEMALVTPLVTPLVTLPLAPSSRLPRLPRLPRFPTCTHLESHDLLKHLESFDRVAHAAICSTEATEAARGWASRWREYVST